jgi:hypothetical protein
MKASVCVRNGVHLEPLLSPRSRAAKSSDQTRSITLFLVLLRDPSDRIVNHGGISGELRVMTRLINDESEEIFFECLRTREATMGNR